jgi:heptose I phosphotransferase
MKKLFTTTLIISDEAKGLLKSAGLASFQDFMDYSGGERICHKRGRSTVRLQTGDRAFYLKRNRFHWVEFFKRLSRLRLPVRGALQEWRNIEQVRAVGVPTLVPIAFGEQPLLGIETSSFSMTEELYGCVPLDQVLVRELSGNLTRNEQARKRHLLRQLGQLARRLHGHGFYHQDFYLSHFFVGSGDMLHLIDLQRVLHQPLRSRHFLIKDLAQLNYAASRIPSLSRTDRLRVLLSYLNTHSLQKCDKKLVQSVLSKTRRIAKHDIKLSMRRRKRGELS